MFPLLAIPKALFPLLAGPVVAGSVVLMILAAAGKSTRGNRWLAKSGLSLPSLRDALIGHPKVEVARVLGSPKMINEGRLATWYYALDTRNQLAMAISFDEERVTAVEFFNAPKAVA